ncbi:GNAT family N-acetyltransferase [Glaesserella parasuis]|uniref:GNAT family N-acetyltransferase n=2 Tax=Glaesserella parasuis TaxID=738 RepID=A0A6G6HS26_GLAPU|nr:GNAT family N-acetyltransferase [Glaesserella parasuis]AGO15595.1 GCN5-related N-acetyltransferase [Glaesserella parasuis ZJ0906]EQA13173.1 acetyltransferase family protein [Glaesserella parasuis 174]AWY44923.1 N-acetyltransferase [Glaesserella parasuis 29755]EQA11589.1 acetyltransferase family protein [Glaesserella parasuis 84-15995]MCT8547886.1 GNAT family N-acetyltransferase [Glaesserella parasuis]
MDIAKLSFIRFSDLTIPRNTFSSSSEELNSYFYTQVSQDIKRRVTNCFVLIDPENQTIVGYYTLAASSISLKDLPIEKQKKLPRYPSVPVVRLGRLALDKRYIGKGLGRFLLVDAILRVVNADIAAYAIVVDAKDKNAAAFYQKYGFLSYADNDKLLYYPLSYWK